MAVFHIQRYIFKNAKKRRRAFVKFITFERIANNRGVNRKRTCAMVICDSNAPKPSPIKCYLKEYSSTLGTAYNPQLTDPFIQPCTDAILSDLNCANRFMLQFAAPESSAANISHEISFNVNRTESFCEQITTN